MPNLVSDILFFWVVKTRKSLYLQVNPDFFWLAPEQICEKNADRINHAESQMGLSEKGCAPLRKQSLFLNDPRWLMDVNGRYPYPTIS